jgi:hypothetical protein
VRQRRALLVLAHRDLRASVVVTIDELDRFAARPASQS